jgi:hypothetical protein
MHAHPFFYNSMFLKKYSSYFVSIPQPIGRGDVVDHFSAKVGANGCFARLSSLSSDTFILSLWKRV